MCCESIVPESEAAITADAVCRQIDMDGALSIRGPAICAPERGDIYVSIC